MMQFNHSQLVLLQILGDGSCHSGNELGEALGITRSAIWKQINQLIDLGIPITRLPHQGYKLPNKFILLNEVEITKHLKTLNPSAFFTFHLFTSIDSTNRYLKDLPVGNAVDVCCAEIQTQGRGRFGRLWHSPFGDNIYCSSRWSLNCDLGKLSGLSLIVSLAILATVNQLNPSSDIKVKWPNDILWGNKKLCGTLIEILAESNGMAQVIIGIGLNVNTDTQNHPLAEKPWCSLYEIFQHRYNRNILIAHLMNNLELYLTQFMDKGLDAFIDEWNQFDYLKGKYITVNQSLATISGIARGINQTGMLILETDQGTKHYLSSGDTSLQSRNEHAENENNMAKITIYHNPQCSKSRKTLEMLQNQGIDLLIIEYLKTPLQMEQLRSLRSYFDLKDFVRTDDPLFKKLGLSLNNEEQLLKAMLKEPRLMQRPIVTYKGKAIIGRPPEKVLHLFEDTALLRTELPNAMEQIKSSSTN